MKKPFFPNGLPPATSPHPLVRFDGWQNAITGMGTLDRDRVTSATFVPDIIGYQTARSLWRGDDMAARAIEVWPDEMLRRGYRILTVDDREVEDAITSHLDTIGFPEALRAALCYQRAYGGGAILLGVNDGSADWSRPLNLDAVISFDWVQTFDASELFPSQWQIDPKKPKFMQPSHYRIGRQGAHKVTSDIHESRFLIFDGIRVSSDYQQSTNNGWGDNILTRLWSVLQGFNTGWAGAWHLLSDFAQGVYKMKGLADNLVNQQASVLARLKIIEMAKSTMRSVVVDADLEDYQRQATPISGLDTVLDRANTRLAAAADMPVMLLFGQSPGGLGSTGSGEIESFYARVSNKQSRILRPALLRVVSLLAKRYNLDPGYKIEFNPLWEPSELEAAQARNTQALTDQIYITTAVVTPEEIAESRFGASGYSFSTKLDWDARDRFNAALDPTSIDPEVETEDPAEIEARNRGQAPPAGDTPPPEI